MQDAGHIARHDPARVLAEVAAKRAIVEHFERLDAQADEAAERGFRSWPVCAAHATGMWNAIRHLAVVYADHPDYQQEWAP